jgi:hypothetical protein
MLVKVRMVRYLRVGGVAFGLCGSRRAVIHDVELLCAVFGCDIMQSSR